MKQCPNITQFKNKYKRDYVDKAHSFSGVLMTGCLANVKMFWFLNFNSFMWVFYMSVDFYAVKRVYCGIISQTVNSDLQIMEF